MPLSLIDLLGALDVLTLLEHRIVRVMTLTGLTIGGLVVLTRGGTTLLGVGLLVAGVVWGLVEAWFYYVHST